MIDELNTAAKINNVEAISRLLAVNCFIMMTEPASGAKRARFFTREAYLKLLADRASKTTVTELTRLVQAVSVSELGDVFVACDVDEKTYIGQRIEWIRSHEYIVMRASGEKMLIQAVIAELAFVRP